MINVREACLSDAEAIAAVRNETWQSAYRGIIAGEYLDAMSLDDATARFAKGLASSDEHFFVAESGGTVIGFSVCGRERERGQHVLGEIYAIYVLPGMQRSGAGRLLIEASTRKLKALGFTSMLLWSLAKNPSNRFYERMGGCLTATRKYAIGSRDYDLVAYEWSNLAFIIDGS
jgi:ribosomal protein S18 acetylase RimI-like enzyme